MIIKSNGILKFLIQIINALLFQWFFIRLTIEGNINYLAFDGEYSIEVTKIYFDRFILPFTGFWNEKLYIKIIIYKE